MTDVYCYADKIPSTDVSAFSGINLVDVTLHVPESALNDYKTTAPWSNFVTIVALTDEEYNGLSTISDIKLNIQGCTDGIISFMGASSAIPVTVYNSCGIEVARSIIQPNVSFDLVTGLSAGEVAIVQIGSRCVKVMMK